MKVVILFFVIAFVILNNLSDGANQDVFNKQILLHELNLQTREIEKELFAKCPNIFDPVGAILGRRRRGGSDDMYGLEIRLAQKTLDDLKQKYLKCLNHPNMTSVYPVMTNSSMTHHHWGNMSATNMTWHHWTNMSMPNMTWNHMKNMTWPWHHMTNVSSLNMTWHPWTNMSMQNMTWNMSSDPRHAFTVLQSKPFMYNRHKFLVLEVRVPVDGMSKSESWCHDYQNLCESFHRKPQGTSCNAFAPSDDPFNRCRDVYNADIGIGSILNCDPSNSIAILANYAFNGSMARSKYNAFGFQYCSPNNCHRTIRASGQALYSMQGFWTSNQTVMYTVCQ